MFIKKRERTRNIVILSTKTPPSTDIGVEELDRQHRDKGCMMVGFHYILRRSGMIETGRELERLGNYSRKYNRDSVYVCLVGDDGNFTPEQLASLAEVELELKDLFPEAELIDLT